MCDAHLPELPDHPRDESCARVSRRAILLGGAVALTAGGVLWTRRATPSPTDAAAATTPIAATSIGGAASAGVKARRMKQLGTVMFPMSTSPRCVVLDNFGDPRGTRRHEGVDLLAAEGQEIYAVADGVLSTQTFAPAASLAGNSWGLTATIGGTYYFYAHLSAFAPGLVLGSSVRRGDVIGYVGDTGNPGVGNHHLHFEVHPGGLRAPAVDPFPLLDIPRVCTVY